MQNRRQRIGVWVTVGRCGRTMTRRAAHWDTVAAASDKGKRMAFGVLDVRNTRCIAKGRIHYDPGKVAQPYFTC